MVHILLSVIFCFRNQSEKRNCQRWRNKFKKIKRMLKLKEKNYSMLANQNKMSWGSWNLKLTWQNWCVYVCLYFFTIVYCMHIEFLKAKGFFQEPRKFIPTKNSHLLNLLKLVPANILFFLSRIFDFELFCFTKLLTLEKAVFFCFQNLRLDSRKKYPWNAIFFSKKNFSTSENFYN